jgi:hypothetical protein
MEIKKYMHIQAICTKENELIPIWDDRITFNKSEDYGEWVMVKGDAFHKYFNFIDCVFNLKTKTIELGIEIDNFPLENDLQFKVGQKVYFKKKYRKLAEATIAEIIYTEYELEVVKGKKLDSRLVEKYKDMEIEGDAMYAIKHWKPFYLLDNGTVVKWKHELYAKAQD